MAYKDHRVVHFRNAFRKEVEDEIAKKFNDQFAARKTTIDGLQSNLELCFSWAISSMGRQDMDLLLSSYNQAYLNMSDNEVVLSLRRSVLDSVKRQFVIEEDSIRQAKAIL